MMKRIIVITAALLILGCSKKSSEAPSNFSIHEEIPSSAVAFIEFDNNSDSGKRFRQSKWAKDFQIVPSEIKEVLLVQKLSKEISFSTDSTRKDSIAEGITYYAVEGITSPIINFGGILKANPGKDLSWTKSYVLGEIKNAGMPISVQSDQKVGEYMEVNVEGGANPDLKRIYILVQQDRFSFASKKEYLGIGTSVADSKSPMISDPRFTSEVAKVKESGAFQFGAVDVGRIMPYLQSEALKVNPQADLSSVPYDLALFGISYDKGYSVQGDLFTIQSSTSPKASSRNNESLAELVPDSSVFSFEISAPLLMAGLGAGLGPVPGGEILQSISRLGLFIKEGGVGSIAPDITLIVSSSDSQKTKEEVVKLADGLSGLFQGAVSPRQQAKVGEIDIDFLVSPIGGLGVFIGNFEGTTVISSSEAAFKDYQDPTKRAANLQSVLKSQKISLTDGIVSGHVDFPKSLALMDSLQGTAALFSPQTVPAEKTVADEMLKNLGFMSFQVQEFDTKVQFSVVFRE